MIDLSFLTDAEQEAILKVLNRDAELKKAEDERVRLLHDVVNNENEFKYKSGQWFYEAKSRRHRDKIHGAELVRASIRKRKKPATIEMFGIMEAPDEAEEDVKLKKEEGNQSSKTVDITSPDKGKVNQGNGIITPAKQRQNPFNSGDSQDYTDSGTNTSNLSPQNGQVNGTPKTKAGEEPLYATVNKTSSSSQAKDKPEVQSTEALNSKKGMDGLLPILSALKRSAAKPRRSVEEAPPTSTNQLNSSNPQEQIPDNSFPSNADKYKQMSQSVPTFLQDETDGRDTDSASESSFQLGRHKKTPSSLTNLSGSSGMASMSSVSGSIMSVYSGDFGNVDVKGAIEFSVDYVEKLSEFMIYIYQCRDLAAADVKKQRSDPYVKSYLLPEKSKMGKRKTTVKKKTLNPVYNEILKYKIPKEALLAQTLNLSVWHHDALGRNSFLGEVNVNLESRNWSNMPRDWHQLEPRTPAAGIGLVHRGEMKLALKYIPRSPNMTKAASQNEYSSFSGSEFGVKRSATMSKAPLTGEVHIWIKECLQLPMLRDKINSFVKCTVLPDTSRKSRQKTRTVDKTTSPIFNHTMVYDGFKEEDLREACVELTVWDHNRLTNHFLGGLRVGLGTGKSYGTAVDWMDSTHEESTMWQKMMSSPNTWIEGLLPLRMFKMAKITK